MPLLVTQASNEQPSRDNFLWFTLVCLLACSSQLVAQPFSSGSTGSDGPLNFTTPGVVLFDPKSFNPPLDPDGDNIYHFTTINIASFVTVKLSGKILNSPVYWLASGDVTISGTLDLGGEQGISAGTASERTFSTPGPGGYSGGLGGKLNISIPTMPGNGPGGGLGATRNNPTDATGGRFSGNQFLVPLVGGSGGGGGLYACTAGLDTTYGPTGGAGGGAILIASSTTVINNGTIAADGGGAQSTCGGGNGGGSGGAIRIVANSILGSGTWLARGGGSGGLPAATTGSNGFIRLEAISHGQGGLAIPAAVQSVPFALLLPTTPAPSIKVSSINSIPVNANPFTFPDVVINSSAPVTVNIEARFVPLNTIPKLIVFSETGPNQTIDCSPLSGTLSLSTSSTTITFPPGGSRGIVKAVWQ